MAIIKHGLVVSSPLGIPIILYMGSLYRVQTSLTLSNTNYNIIPEIFESRIVEAKQP